MPQQMDLLFHTDTIRTLCLFAMDASTDGLVVTHRHYCYIIYTRLVAEAAVLTINQLCHICVCDARRTDSWCDISLRCMIVYQYVFIVFMYGELPWDFLYPS